MLMLSFFPSVSLFFSMLLFSVIVVLSASNWMIVWVGMELNMLSFLPLITMGDGVGRHAEAAGKYFLAQAAGSALFLFSPIFWGLPYSELYSVFLILGLLLKMGAAPFHQWFPSVVASLPWSVNLILMTLQKISPMISLLVVVFPVSLSFIFFLAILNLFFGAMGGLAQSQLRPLFAYSSISHMGWMLGLLGLSVVGFMSYLVFYMMILTPLIILMMKFSSNSVKIMGGLIGQSKTFLFLFSITLLSLGGMPPFSGFFMKAFSLFIMLESGLVLVGLLFVFFATVSLAYYINILFMSVLCGSGVFDSGSSQSVGVLLGPMFLLSAFMLPLIVGVMV